LQRFVPRRRLIKAAFTFSVDAVGMQHAILPLSPEAWFRHLFSSQSARDGGVVRRKVRDMERMVGRDAFAAEIRRRGYSAVENAGQIIVFCNAEPVKVAVG
jgi:hypothetical protein